MRVAVRVALRETDAVRIVACATWRVVVADMRAVLAKTLVAEDAVAVVTGVTSNDGKMEPCGPSGP